MNFVLKDKGFFSVSKMKSQILLVLLLLAFTMKAMEIKVQTRIFVTRFIFEFIYFQRPDIKDETYCEANTGKTCHHVVQLSQMTCDFCFPPYTPQLCEENESPCCTDQEIGHCYCCSDLE